MKLLSQGFPLSKLKSSLRKLYCRHHDLVDRYGISVSQITTDMFHLSQTLSGRVTRTPLKTEGELRCSGRVISSCSNSGTRRVNLVTNPVISHEWGKDRKVFASICNIPAAPAYGVYISQLIRYSRACGSYQDFIDRGLLPNSGTRRVNLVTNPVISHEWGKDRKVFATSGTYPW
jgi:hypothetical protein